VFHIRIRISILALAFIVCTSVSASAQSADEKAIAAYRLTMPTIKKAMAVTESFVAELAKDPRVQEMQKLKAQIKALDEKEELTEAQQAELEKLREREEALEQEMDRAVGFNNNQTLADMEAAMKKEPAAMRALAQEGLTPREYALCMMTLLQASMVEGFSQGKADLSKLPPGVNPENVKFVREHKAELEAMQGALGKTKK
jgi:hypothetical protein